MRFLWVRMYPKWARPGAAYVVDRLARKEIVADQYGLAVAETFQQHPDEPGFVNVEWDCAIDLTSIAAMEAHIANCPHALWYAPYSGWDGVRPAVPTNRGLGCTWLPRLLYERFEGLAETRYPQLDGAVITFAQQHGIDVCDALDVSVMHVHW